MGNSFCCSFQDKQSIIYSELMMENIGNYNEKESKEHSNLDKNFTKEISNKKSIFSLNPDKDEYIDLENPLPEIIKIIRKKQ